MRGIKALWSIAVISLVLCIGVMNVDALPETYMTLEPYQVSADIGDTVTVDIIVHNVEDLFAWQVNMTWDNSVINVTADYDEEFHYWIPRVTWGDAFAGASPEGTTQATSMNWYQAEYIFGESIKGEYDGVDGSVWLATIEFEVFGTGNSIIDIASKDANHVGEADATTYLLDSSAVIQIPVTCENSYFVQPPSSPWDQDINEDGLIDIRDIAMIAIKFGWSGTPGSIPEDVDEDGYVDVDDLVAVAQVYGQYYP